MLLLSIGAMALSAWQIAQTLFKIFPAALPPAGLPVYLIAGLAGFAVLAALPGHFIRIIRSAGQGKDLAFNWGELADVQNAVLAPVFKFLLITFWSFMPIEMYLALMIKNQGTISPLAIFTLLVFSFLYFPMALLMTAVTGKLMPSLLPSNIIEPIFKTLKQYILFLFLFWAVFLLPLLALLLWPVPFIGPLAFSFILLYLWSCGMNLLGGFYRKEKEGLNWQ
ncbi:MAG: hypothetical protein RDU76_01675 [Candidatus Edwardsbacteria bacterium]|nr:hypothetical protein [Candidatus Edwardsbacteria bacterium]